MILSLPVWKNYLETEKSKKTYPSQQEREI